MTCFLPSPTRSSLVLLSGMLLLLATGSSTAQQTEDPEFDAVVENPAYSTQGPTVAIDQAHSNFHTVDGRYRPFAELLRSDGYEVVANEREFAPGSLGGIDILVIANANAGNQVDGAFSEAECDALRDWVMTGGALLLIADHTPFGASAAKLAERFGIGMGKGWVFDAVSGKFSAQLVFSRDNGLLGGHPIMRGRTDSESVRIVKSFAGQSLRLPEGASGLLHLSDTAREAPDRDALNAEAAAYQGEPGSGSAGGRSSSVAGRVQGLAMQFGQGKIAAFGEAAMFSAQVVTLDGQNGPITIRAGMNVPGYDNRQLALNVMHWLSGALGSEASDDPVVGATQSPAPDAVLARARTALGGPQAIARVQSIDALARGSGPNGTFLTRIFSHRDGAMRFEQRGPNGYSLMGVRADAAWSYDAESDTRQPASTSVTAFLQSHELHLIALAPELRFGPPLRADAATFHGQPAFAVTFADALEEPLEVYYHRTFALPLGLRIRNPFQSDESRIDIVLEEWDPRDGLLLFTRVRFLQGDDVFQYHYADLQLNTLSASDFQATDDRLIDPDVAVLLQLHQQHREDHLNGDAERFVSTFHEPFLSIDSGHVEVSSRDEARERFQSYFDSVEFQAWNDITPPIVEISLDGTLATVIVHKHVQLTYENEEGEIASDDTVFTWAETWQKLDDAWKVVNVTSTDRPGDK